MTVNSRHNVSQSSDLVRVALRLSRSDYEYIQAVAAAGESTTNRLIRAIVADYARRLRALEREKIDASPTRNRDLSAEVRELLTSHTL
jgi:hypothetical protein